MKKKDKAKKQTEMPEFSFKEFTPEEDKIYEEAVIAYREALAAGKTLRQAYDGHTIADQELRSIIQVDFLKILIAERHFAQQQPLAEIAQALDVPLALITETHARMLQEVGVTAANQFGQEFGSLNPSAQTTDD